MSIPSFSANDPPLTRADVINQVLASIAMEELGLSHIINAEGEKLQYVLGTIPGMSGPGASIQDVLDVNESVRGVLQSAAENQSLLRQKLQSALSAGVLTGPTGSTGPTGPAGPFLSCYLEASANKQTVGTEENIAFDTDPDNDAIDIVGDGITVNAEGTVFTINRTGLYHVAWSVDLSSFTEPAIIGIAENGEGISAITASAAGNVSSGALIHVDTTPYFISLENFAGEIQLQNPVDVEGASASIRIFRFADGPIQ